MRAYLTAFTTSARRALSNKAALAARVGMYLVILGVLSALWKAATEARGPIAGYDYASMLWYLTVAEAAVISIDPRLIEYVGSDIGDGSVTVEMLRPISVVGFRMAATLGECMARFAFALACGAAFAWFQVGAPPSGRAALIALPAMLLALSANLASQYCFAALAFWVQDSKAAWFLYHKLVFLLGGMLLPLELMPPALERAARLLPFQAMAYTPARLASGHFEPLLLVVQAAWLVTLLTAAVYVFSLGQRRLTVVGA